MYYDIFLVSVFSEVKKIIFVLTVRLRSEKLFLRRKLNVSDLLSSWLHDCISHKPFRKACTFRTPERQLRHRCRQQSEELPIFVSLVRVIRVVFNPGKCLSSEYLGWFVSVKISLNLHICSSVIVEAGKGASRGRFSALSTTTMMMMEVITVQFRIYWRVYSTA
jgi:hypothetical protein